jgi:hypothetical protein
MTVANSESVSIDINNVSKRNSPVRPDAARDFGGVGAIVDLRPARNLWQACLSFHGSISPAARSSPPGSRAQRLCGHAPLRERPKPRPVNRELPSPRGSAAHRRVAHSDHSHLTPTFITPHTPRTPSIRLRSSTSPAIRAISQEEQPKQTH